MFLLTYKYITPIRSNFIPVYFYVLNLQQRDISKLIKYNRYHILNIQTMENTTMYTEPILIQSI